MKIRSLAMFFKLFNKSTCKLIMKFIGPSFIFYCYSKETPQGFECLIITVPLFFLKDLEVDRAEKMSL